MKALITLYKAWTYARDGLLDGFKNERAIRQEVLAFILLTPVAALLPLSTSLKLALIGTMALVLIVEFLNTAIEKTVDYISINQHPQAKKIKDMGSAAVFISLAHSGLWWAYALISSFA
jgi:diacylglycerol kinase (ATP)